MSDNNEKSPEKLRSEKSLFTKMASIMGELKRLPKNGYNSYHRYEYATDADVLDTIRQKMAEYNIAFFASMVDHNYEEITTNDGKTAYHIIVKLEFTFACGDTGQTMTLSWRGESIDTNDKGTSKAATTGEKYFLLKTFMLSTGDVQDDADNTSPEIVQRNNNGHRPKPPSSNGGGVRRGSSAPKKPPSNGTAKASSNDASNGTTNGSSPGRTPISPFTPWQHQEINLTEIRNMYERWEKEPGSSDILVEDAKKQLGSVMSFATLADYQTRFAETIKRIIADAEGVPF
ncbi:ERF family protein [Phototrophicus methaneseepsis]|uniref:ERF family protein n=1 Tax=Phototrophicus methaneseepsis TaxID=2710758 RepID=A0A7S8IFM5_9CHLR|nr:ERF family protein [Phototrophicus methaneseepsis]QPC83761.1 ERF family protein [Phototrophicus methaneseepsis]